MDVIFRVAQNVSDYEDAHLQELALETLPFDQLYAEAESGAADAQADPAEGFEDRLVRSFLHWFKRWFVWVNQAPCEKCGGETVGRGGTAPTAEEKQHQAGVTELYWCDKCRHTTRFPRYGSLQKVLETHCGRCGEWCAAATLFLRALGLETRYIWNSEDHVWNEVWSDALQRWVHIDSCEEAYDKPLTYTDGWGKKMAYVIGFSKLGATDVTRRYVRRPEMQLPRSQFNEDQLQKTLNAITEQQRLLWEPEDQVLWFERDEAEQAELLSLLPSQPGEELPRQSGSAEWTHSRGEDGQT